MAITYTVSIPQLAQLQSAFKRAPELTTRAIATAINKSLVGYQATAKQLSPIDTGRLRSSILITPARIRGNTVEGSVGTNLKYAGIQEGGSGIYGPRHAEIVPKRAKMLAWKKNGTWHFAKRVKGVRGRFFFKGSLERNQTKTEGYFQAAADEVVSTLAKGGQMSAYVDIGQALYDLVAAIDVSAITGIATDNGWGARANYSVKQLASGQFPAFDVVPAEDVEVDLDAISDLKTITYWLTIYVSFEAASTSEGQLRQIVDLLADVLPKEKRDSSPLGGACLALQRMTGTWGADTEQGLRFFRVAIEADVDQATI